MGQISFFPLMAFLVPGAVLLLQFAFARRRTRHWQEEAARLGLHSSGHAPALRLWGEFRGVTVQVEHHAEERYKRSPSITFVARVRLPEGVRPIDVNAHRWSSEFGFSDSVVDGWFERVGRGYFGEGGLRTELEMLIEVAREGDMGAR